MGQLKKNLVTLRKDSQRCCKSSLRTCKLNLITGPNILVLYKNMFCSDLHSKIIR